MNLIIKLLDLGVLMRKHLSSFFFICKMISDICNDFKIDIITLAEPFRRICAKNFGSSFLVFVTTLNFIDLWIVRTLPIFTIKLLKS